MTIVPHVYQDKHKKSFGASGSTQQLKIFSIECWVHPNIKRLVLTPFTQWTWHIRWRNVQTLELYHVPVSLQRGIWRLKWVFLRQEAGRALGKTSPLKVLSWVEELHTEVSNVSLYNEK